MLSGCGCCFFLNRGVKWDTRRRRHLRRAARRRTRLRSRPRRAMPRTARRWRATTSGAWRWSRGRPPAEVPKEAAAEDTPAGHHSRADARGRVLGARAGRAAERLLFVVVVCALSLHRRQATRRKPPAAACSRPSECAPDAAPLHPRRPSR